MIKAAKKHKAMFAPINLSQELREKLPAWRHLGEEKVAPRNQQARCLAKNHNSERVKDLLKITERLQNEYNRGLHKLDYTCQCEDCTNDKANGCENPQCCALEAKKRIQRITPKLHPLRPPNSDNLTGPRTNNQGNRREEPTDEDESDDEENPGITFDPSVTIKTDLTDCFRIFVDPNRVTNEPAMRQPPPQRDSHPGRKDNRLHRWIMPEQWQGECPMRRGNMVRRRE